MESTNIPNNSFVPQDNKDTENSKQNNLKKDIEDDNINILPIQCIELDRDLIDQTLQELQENEVRINLIKVLDDEVECIEFVEPLNTMITLDSVILNEEKVVFNAVELMARGSVELDYLMSPIFPQKGTAVLAGKPDTGKSQLARQLCIQVALGENNFIGFELNPIHNRSIYVATEDNQEATAHLLSKQLEGLNYEPVENLRFIFADTMEQEEILRKIDEELTLCPADLVVIDSFGDIFKGGDANNNMAMRNTVKLFDKISKKHNCLVLFVHHINKAAYRVAPSQEHIQGGSGLAQKVRLAIQLSEGSGNKRYFTVVKGNYCPKEYKQKSLELEFSEDTFLFSNTGNMILTSDIGSQKNNVQTDKKNDELEKNALTILSGKLITYGDFVKRFCEITGKSEATAKRAISDLVQSGFIEKVQGNYRLNTITEDDDESDESEDEESVDCEGLVS